MFRKKILDRERVKIGWLFGLAVFLCVTASAQSDLQLNEPFEREIKKGKTQIFKVSAKEGDFARVVVRQKKCRCEFETFLGKR